MPIYNYACGECKHPDFPDCDLIWEVSHKMDEKPKVCCPLCNKRAKKTLEGTNITSYIRGNCYLDKEGAKRDMNLFKLQREDPYGHMRQPGEADHLADQLRRAGKHKTRRGQIIASTKIKSDESKVRIFKPPPK